MKTKFLFIIMVSLASLTVEKANACTTFVINDSTHLIFGRNFDFDFGEGYICLNRRGLKKTSFVREPDLPVRWTARYGSITFNQVGIDNPMGGMNEKGLVIAQMALPGSVFPESNGKEVLGELDWIQFQLDNSASLNEVIENNTTVRISPVAVPVHYMVCDSSGNTAIFEYVNGDLKLYKPDDIIIPVCSNMTYAQSVASVEGYRDASGNIKMPGSCITIPDIIATGFKLINDYKNQSENEDVINYSFSILKEVGNMNRTQWSIVFDIYEKEIMFKSKNNRNIRRLRMEDFDYEYDTQILVLSVENSRNNGCLRDQFVVWSKKDYLEHKIRILELYRERVPGFPDIPNEIVQREVDYIFECRY